MKENAEAFWHGLSRLSKSWLDVLNLTKIQATRQLKILSELRRRKKVKDATKGCGCKQRGL